MPDPPSPLCVVQLTPPGRGAVATLRVEGLGAVAAVESRFCARIGRPLAACGADEIVVGRCGGNSGEEVVVRRRDDGAVEIHCHGGRAAVDRIKQSLVAAGCWPLSWQEWTRARTDDPIAAAALLALAEARSERTAAILLDQYHGALRDALHKIRQQMDRGDAPAACRQIDALLARQKLGAHLIRPWSVVLAGRINVGKSSLLNALAGYARAIVHPAPGTTRDAVAITAAIDGWPVELCDTAGLRAAGDAVERAGIDRARERLAAADLVILVTDRSAPWSAGDETLTRQWPAAVLVHNKCDLPPAAGHRPAGISTSALGTEGIGGLLAAISRRLVPDPPPPGAPLPFSSEQVDVLRQWRAAMSA